MIDNLGLFWSVALSRCTEAFVPVSLDFRIQTVDELLVVPLASGRSRVGQRVALMIAERELGNAPQALDYLVEAS